MTHSGRVAIGRRSSPSAYCFGCNARLTIGDPRPTQTWPARVRLSKNQEDAILTAAVEYAALSKEAGEPETALGFADWLIGVARMTGGIIDHDGGRARLESGGFGRQYNHRHPDPLPVADLPDKIRRAAR